MNKYTLQQFDSHNTCFDRDIWARNFETAQNKAQRLSKMLFHPVIINNGSRWVKFEQGEKIGWSA